MSELCIGWPNFGHTSLLDEDCQSRQTARIRHTARQTDLTRHTARQTNRIRHTARQEDRIRHTARQAGNIGRQQDLWSKPRNGPCYVALTRTRKQKLVISRMLRILHHGRRRRGGGRGISFRKENVNVYVKNLWREKVVKANFDFFLNNL